MCPEVYPKTKTSILVLGPFRDHRASEAALLEAVFSQLNAQLPAPPHYVVPVFDPEWIDRRLDSDYEAIQIHANPRRGHLGFWGPATLSVLRQCSLVLTVGSLVPGYSWFDFKNNFVLRLLPLLAVISRKDIPIIGYNIDISSPVSWSLAGRQIVKCTLGCHSQVFVRSHTAQAFCNKLGLGRKVHYSTDVRLTSKPAEKKLVDSLLTMHRVNPSIPVLALNIVPGVGLFDTPSFFRFVDNTSTFVRLLRQSLGVQLVFVCCSAFEERVAQTVLERMGIWLPILSFPLFSHSELIGVLACSQLTVTNNPELCILSMAAGTPVFSWESNPEYYDLMQAAGLRECYCGAEVQSVEDMIECVVGAWEHRSATAEDWKRYVSGVKDLARAPAVAVADILKAHCDA